VFPTDVSRGRWKSEKGEVMGLKVEVGDGRQARMRATHSRPTNCVPPLQSSTVPGTAPHFIFYRTFFLAHDELVASRQPTRQY